MNHVTILASGTNERIEYNKREKAKETTSSKSPQRTI